MGLLLLGLLIGFGAGFFVARRQYATPVVDDVLPVPRIAVTPIEAPPEPSKKARRLGLSERDFVPADDILQKMQQAWVQGEQLDLADDAAESAEPVGTTPDLADMPPPASPPAAAPGPVPRPDPTADPRLARVFARLEGQAPEGVTPPTAPSTATEAVEQLRSEGYGDELHLDGTALACSNCGASHPTDTVEVDRVLRFATQADPGNGATVFALRCPACGTKASLVSPSGSDVDPERAATIADLAGRARQQ